MEEAYVTAHGNCFCCGRLFSFHPRKVPSYEDHPICGSCVERINGIRKEKELPLWPVPEGAYDPAPESEVF